MFIEKKNVIEFPTSDEENKIWKWYKNDKL